MIFIELIHEIKKIAGLELLKFKAWLLVVAFTGGVGVALEFINLHIWTPSEALVTFLFLLVCDFAAAVHYAWKRNNFESRKAFRIVYKMVAYVTLFAIAHNLAKYDPFYFWLPQAVYFPSVAILLLSFVKNLSLLGYIPKSLAVIIKNKIDVYKNIDIKENKENKENGITKKGEAGGKKDN